MICRKRVMQAFQPLKFTVAYSAGATLFVEGQVCRGIYILCKGRVKLSASSKEGQTLIFKVSSAWRGSRVERGGVWNPARDDGGNWSTVPTEFCKTGRL